jgi:hypothetical protein
MRKLFGFVLGQIPSHFRSGHICGKKLVRRAYFYRKFKPQLTKQLLATWGVGGKNERTG